MSAVVLVVFGITFALAGLVLVFLWLMCRGRGIAAAAGRPALIAGVVLLALAALSIGPALAHDPYADWKTRNGVSCCHNRDCAPATAWPNGDGSWTARQNGRTYFVPDTSVLALKSPDGRSHACVIGGTVICFVPGETRS